MKDMPEPKNYLFIDQDELPEIKSWKVGSSYTVTAKIKEVGMSQDEDDKGKKSLRARFEIVKISPVKKTSYEYPPEIVKKVTEKD